MYGGVLHYILLLMSTFFFNTHVYFTIVDLEVPPAPMHHSPQLISAPPRPLFIVLSTSCLIMASTKFISSTSDTLLEHRFVISYLCRGLVCLLILDLDSEQLDFYLNRLFLLHYLHILRIMIGLNSSGIPVLYPPLNL